MTTIVDISRGYIQQDDLSTSEESKNDTCPCWKYVLMFKAPMLYDCNNWMCWNDDLFGLVTNIFNLSITGLAAPLFVVVYRLTSKEIPGHDIISIDLPGLTVLDSIKLQFIIYSLNLFVKPNMAGEMAKIPTVWRLFAGWTYPMDNQRILSGRKICQQMNLLKIGTC